MWSAWQVGVKAPGTETRTTFLFWNSTSKAGELAHASNASCAQLEYWHGNRKRTLAGIVLGGDAASRNLGGLGRRRDVGEGNTLGEGVSGFEGRHLKVLFWSVWLVDWVIGK